MCFQARKGSLRPTTEFETLRKDPKLVFQFVKDGISSMNKAANVHIANYSSYELKHMVGVFVQSLKISGRPIRA